MIHFGFYILLALLARASSILNIYNPYSSATIFAPNTKGNLFNHKYRIIKARRHDPYSLSNNITLFINTPSYTFSKFNNWNLQLTPNDLEQYESTKLPEESNLIDLTTHESSDKINHPNQSVIISTDPKTEFPKTRIPTSFISGESLKEETPQIITGKLVKSSSLESGVTRFFTKSNLKNTVQAIKKDLNRVKKAIGLFLYPREASDDIIRYTNWKILERLSLSISSAIALNIKPITFTVNDNEKDESNSIKNKLTGSKMSTIVFTVIFKDVFSRILNYYWFNKVIRLSDNPKAYRLLSTLGYSLVTLWDFFINMMSIEPKTVLLAVNHILKQLFLGSHNLLNQLYYNTKIESTQMTKNNDESSESFNKYKVEESNTEVNSQSDLNQTDQSQNFKNLKTAPLNQFKDESNFVFDLMGMALGTYTSYLLNSHNSDNLKLISIVSALITTNLLTSYVTTLV